jgi:hypothetical protein
VNALTALDAPLPSMDQVTRQRSGIPLSWIAALLLGWIAADNILLYGFLGFGVPLTVAASVVIGVLVGALTIRAGSAKELRVATPTMLACLILAIAILMLGGEGRILYANADWQIRDALLADMGHHPWPYVTRIGGVDQIVRAPLGMYLKPALIGGADQGLRDLALLACNALMLTGILVLGSALFETAKARAIAFAVFFVFSGMDIFGAMFRVMTGEWPGIDHIELWNSQSQFSSHITMAFWVPQHAMAGWICAVLLLLWRRGAMPFGAFAAAIPLVAIWSPLAIMGAVPFALLAGIETLVRRQVRVADIALAAMALAVAIGPLLYLRAGSEAVVSRLTNMTPLQYAIVLALEIVPFSVILLMNQRRIGLGNAIPLTTVIFLVLIPLYCIGEAIDFQMRASIVPLAIMALGIARVFANADGLGRAVRPVAVALLVIGACTPAMEIRRALVLGPSPSPACTLVDAWHQQSGEVKPTYAIYFAPLDALPESLRGEPASRILPDRGARCWDRPWQTPRG